MNIKHAYRKGRRFEYRVKDFLERQGFFVLRQAKSSFPDLFAIKLKRSKDYEIRLVECRIDGSISIEEKVKLCDLAKRIKAKPFIATKSGRKLVLKELK
ncbi:MAG: hypothetical protein QXT31_02230 [Candidatus Bathyarchaeia archaeon]